jgi:hypothetical protein
LVFFDIKKGKLIASLGDPAGSEIKILTLLFTML